MMCLNLLLLVALAAPARAADVPSLPAAASAPTGSASSPDSTAPPVGRVGPSDTLDGPPAPGCPTPAGLPPDPGALDRLDRRFAREPGVGDVHRWAVLAGQLEPGRGDRLLQDARARGALPLVRLRGQYDDRSNRKWSDVVQPPLQDHDADWALDLWLEWDLAELAAGPDLARAAREGRAIGELRAAVLAEATLVYFDRRRVLTEAALDPCPHPAAEAERRLRHQELDATLDALTAGRWSAALEAPVRAPIHAAAPEDAPHERVHRPGEDPDPGLRVPVHAADRPPDP